MQQKMRRKVVKQEKGKTHLKLMKRKNTVYKDTRTKAIRRLNAPEVDTRSIIVSRNNKFTQYYFNIHL